MTEITSIDKQRKIKNIASMILNLVKIIPGYFLNKVEDFFEVTNKFYANKFIYIIFLKQRKLFGQAYVVKK